MLLVPRFPALLSPHAQTWPLDFKAKTNCDPGATSVNRWFPRTDMGDDLLFIVPSPSWPIVLVAHDQIVPSDFREYIAP